MDPFYRFLLGVHHLAARSGLRALYQPPSPGHQLDDRERADSFPSVCSCEVGATHRLELSSSVHPWR